MGEDIPVVDDSLNRNLRKSKTKKKHQDRNNNIC